MGPEVVRSHCDGEFPGTVRPQARKAPGPNDGGDDEGASEGATYSLMTGGCLRKWECLRKRRRRRRCALHEGFINTIRGGEGGISTRLVRHLRDTCRHHCRR